jgi:hypothetical protein
VRPGDIASRSTQARHKALSDRIGRKRHHNRDCRGRLLGRLRLACRSRDDHVDAVPQESGDELGEAVDPARRRTASDHEVAAFQVAELAHSFKKGVPHHFLRGNAPHREEADAINLPLLLRARSNRRSEETTRNTANERSAVHH